MKREAHIELTILDWPVFGKQMRMALSRRLYPTPDHLADWARRRFGPGTLRRRSTDGPDEHWAYQRESAAPRGLLRLFTFLLNRSYD